MNGNEVRVRPSGGLPRQTASVSRAAAGDPGGRAEEVAAPVLSTGLPCRKEVFRPARICRQGQRRTALLRSSPLAPWWKICTAGCSTRCAFRAPGKLGWRPGRRRLGAMRSRRYGKRCSESPGPRGRRKSAKIHFSADAWGFAMSMSDRDGFIWYDGKLVPWRDATTHVLTHSLHYGLAVFEGVRAYKTAEGPAIFRLADHTQRLFNSGRIYLMQIPYEKEQLMAAQREVVRANKLESCYLRPIAFYGSEKM